MLALVIGCVAIAGLAACIASDPEYIQCIKEAIYWLVKAGYDSDKIVQIMHMYVHY
ncbi:MAG: hypothetical protein ABSF44_13490 [Candidatus Bathyarchaeia archaeon]